MPETNGVTAETNGATADKKRKAEEDQTPAEESSAKKLYKLDKYAHHLHNHDHNHSSKEKDSAVSEEGKEGKEGKDDEDKIVGEAAMGIVHEALKAGVKKPLPVSILSGFLGSGKTTLMKHVLENQKGLRVAVIVNDMAEVNIDAMLLQMDRDGSKGMFTKTKETFVELSNGCICCTLREDLFTSLGELAMQQRFDHVLIESSGISEPMAVAETFTFADESGASLSQIAELHNLVTVVDASTFLDELNSLEKLEDRRWNTTPEDKRDIAQLMCEQVDFADVMVLNKLDLVKDDTRVRLQDILRKFNPKCDFLNTTYGRIDPVELLNKNRFKLSDAEKHPQWLKSQDGLVPKKPETLEYGVSSFIFKAKRPFHPERFHKAMTEREGTPLAALVRAKGIVWWPTLANNCAMASLAGKRFTVHLGSPWFVTIDKEDWADDVEELVAPNWDDEHGDRHTEVVFIGVYMDEAACRGILDKCLLTDKEFKAGYEKLWYYFEDPFCDQWKEMEDLLEGEEDEKDTDEDDSDEEDEEKDQKDDEEGGDKDAAGDEEQKKPEEENAD